MSDLSDAAALAAAALPPLATQMLDALGVPAWLHLPGRPLQTNAALRRLCGLADEKAVPADPLHLLVPDDRAALAEASSECLWRSGEPPAQSVHQIGRASCRERVCYVV